MRRTLVVTAIALIVTSAAAAHVTISPPYVENGVETEIAFQTPNERPPHATVTLAVTAPPGISVDSAAAPPGWRADVSGSTVTWSGGRLEGRESVRFPLRVTARAHAGTHSFAAVQGYDDGARVEWKSDLSVLPATGAAAPKQHPWGALVAALVGAVVIGLSLVAVRAFRRRALQDQ